MTKPNKFDVIIVGNGITGLSTAAHLKKCGINNIALCTSDSKKTSNLISPGIFTGGQIDNFTRFSHNYGSEIARQLWEFGDRAYNELLNYCLQNKIEAQTGKKARLITSSSELQEAEIAVAQLLSAGLSAELISPSSSQFSNILTSRVLALQIDGSGGATADSTKILNALAADSEPELIGRLVRLEQKNSLQVAHTSTGAFEAEMIVLACHLAIGDYLPEVKDALISVADQWSKFSTVNVADSDLKDNLIYSANHTYEWGYLTQTGTMVAGGGRYLRKHAGIEAATADFEQNIETHLLAKFRATFNGISPADCLGQLAALDCRPCDELPIIGPMYGNSRLLLATGYMGNGLALGFYAGRCLAEIIANGTSDLCPRRLHPERLRTLES